MAPNNNCKEELKARVREEPMTINEIIPQSDDADFSKESIPFKRTLIWPNIIFLTLIHALGLYGAVVCGGKANIKSWIFGFATAPWTAFGVTAGAHRLWTHRSYKAKWPLRIFLLCCYSMAGQNPLFDWVRDHRVHHKFSETDADPHNANRGFFFAHVGWLMQKKHPEVTRKGKSVDMSDILADPIVAFHTKYYIFCQVFFCFFIPMFVPYYFWNENPWIVLTLCGMFRYIVSLNSTWLVNSAAHIWGNKPYDKRISPAENLAVSIFAYGEGWHNYHHVFPWDYKAAELGNYTFNLTTMFLDFCAKIGLAYDLKQPSKQLVRQVAEKYGDGTHVYCPSTHEVDENGNPTNCCQMEEKENI